MYDPSAQDSHAKEHRSADRGQVKDRRETSDVFPARGQRDIAMYSSAAVGQCICIAGAIVFLCSETG